MNKCILILKGVHICTFSCKTTNPSIVYRSEIKKKVESSILRHLQKVKKTLCIDKSYYNMWKGMVIFLYDKFSSKLRLFWDSGIKIL